MLKKYLIKLNKKLKQRDQLKRLNHVPLFNTSILQQKKTSDTLFILGSSSSINDITNKQWEEIQSHDSIGLNRFLFHDTHNPTFYWYEFSNRFIYDYYVLEELKKKLDYKDVPFIINFNSFQSTSLKLDVLPDQMRNNVMFFIPRVLKNYSKDTLIKELKDFPKNTSNIHYDSLLHVRGSIATCVLIAWTLGYKKIVLPGVDLVNQDYFFYHTQNKNALNLKKWYGRLESYDNRFKTDGLHRTERDDLSKSFGMPSMTEYLVMIYDHLLNPHDCSLFAFSNQSLLARHFPVYEC